MTVDGSMSSGYCSLEEELEDCFFTAKTTFFRSAPGKRPAQVSGAAVGFAGGGGGSRCDGPAGTPPPGKREAACDPGGQLPSGPS